MANPLPKRSREKYSRLICLGCRERRIRCELPSEIALPKPGELQTVQTPCYRCKRLGVPCVIRQTILGRPSPGSECASTVAAADIRPAGSGVVVSRVVVELPLRMVVCGRSGGAVQCEIDNKSVVPQTVLCSSSELPPNQDCS